jgi:uncharacterized radical SAM protein YgiQ
MIRSRRSKMFLPVSKEDMNKAGWESADVIFVSGDAYVDHPSFGPAVITRVLEDAGFNVAFIAQPQSDSDFQALGKPGLCFMVSAGNIDPMVARYTAAKKTRSQDAYSPGGKAGMRPDRCTDVYCKTLRKLYPDVPVIIGGLEASLRRFAHYDYWNDEVRPSILETSGADLLVFGMGEKQCTEIAQRLRNGEHTGTMTDIPGTCFMCTPENTPYTGTEVPSYKNCCLNKKEYAKACRKENDEQDPIRGKLIKQRQTASVLVQNIPAMPLTTEEMDHVYELPYERTYHPMYEKYGGVPGIEEVRFSITHTRGCFGDCNFCSITLHQGRMICSRSHESVIKEAKLLTTFSDFKGYIHDVGGPTANFRHPSCAKQLEHGLCKDRRCLVPQPCPNIDADHSDYTKLLQELRALPGVKKVFIRSGIRYDYVLCDKNDDFMKELVDFHVSGQLKVAPEHCCDNVLALMGKPTVDKYLKFSKEYFRLTKEAGKEQYLVPYLISSHPGSSLNDAVDLAVFLKAHHIRPEQVQDFYPTPGTVSTCMFYTGIDPLTMNDVYVAKDPHEKAMQRALLQYFDPKNKRLIDEALKITHRKL